MSTEIATLDRVRVAAIEIRGAGLAPTADRVIKQLGGGSKATVLRHLKALRDGDGTEHAIPATILELARPALTEVFAAGAKAESERSAAGLIRLTQAIQELDAQVDELLGEHTELRETIEALEAERSRLGAENAALADLVTSTRKDLQTTRNELALERGASAEKLAGLMSRIEASVANISEGARRQTRTS